jgi:hypothetical protein
VVDVELEHASPEELTESVFAVTGQKSLAISVGVLWSLPFFVVSFRIGG